MPKYRVTVLDGEIFDSFDDATRAVQERVPRWETARGIYILDAEAEYATSESFVYDTCEASWVTVKQWHINEEERMKCDSLACDIRKAIAMRWIENEAPYSIVSALYDYDALCYGEDWSLDDLLDDKLYWHRNPVISSDEVIRVLMGIAQEWVNK